MLHNLSHLSLTQVAHGTLQTGEHTHKRHGTEREAPPTPLLLFVTYRRSQKGFCLWFTVRPHTHMSSRTAEVIPLREDMKRPQTDEIGRSPRGNRSLWKNRIASLILCSICASASEVFCRGEDKKSSRASRLIDHASCTSVSGTRTSFQTGRFCPSFGASRTILAFLPR
jgi:hypothetical protein